MGGEARGHVACAQPPREAPDPARRLVDDAHKGSDAGGELRRRQRARPFVLDAAPVGEIRQVMEHGNSRRRAAHSRARRWLTGGAAIMLLRVEPEFRVAARDAAVASQRVRRAGRVCRSRGRWRCGQARARLADAEEIVGGEGDVRVAL